MHIKQHAWVPSIPYLNQDVCLILAKMFTSGIYTLVTNCELTRSQNNRLEFYRKEFYNSTYQKPLSIYAVLSHDFLTVLIL